MGIVIEETDDSVSMSPKMLLPDLRGECERAGDGLELVLVGLESVSSDRYLFSGGDKAMERGSAPRLEHVVGTVAVIFNVDDGVGARCLDEGPGEPGVDDGAGDDGGQGEVEFGL